MYTFAYKRGRDSADVRMPVRVYIRVHADECSQVHQDKSWSLEKTHQFFQSCVGRPHLLDEDRTQLLAKSRLDRVTNHPFEEVVQPRSTAVERHIDGSDREAAAVDIELRWHDHRCGE